MNSRYFSVLFLLIISGCATNTGVIPIGKDSYMLSREAGTGFSGIASLKVAAYKEAGAYCVSNNKQLQMIRVEETKPPFILGNYPRVELNFQCLKDGDPGLTPTRLQREPDTIIEYRK